MELEYLFGYMPEDFDFVKEPDGDMQYRFYQLWTAKEAYGKYTGEGLLSFSAKERNYSCCSER